jgi:hypothetical protein
MDKVQKLFSFIQQPSSEPFKTYSFFFSFYLEFEVQKHNAQDPAEKPDFLKLSLI